MSIQNDSMQAKTKANNTYINFSGNVAVETTGWAEKNFKSGI
jgi:hypothetical protein